MSPAMRTAQRDHAHQVSGFTSLHLAACSPLIPFDSYNISRVEINRGANSVLLGRSAIITTTSPTSAGATRTRWKSAENFGSFRRSRSQPRWRRTARVSRHRTERRDQVPAGPAFKTTAAICGGHLPSVSAHVDPANSERAGFVRLCRADIPRDISRIFRPPAARRSRATSITAICRELVLHQFDSGRAADEFRRNQRGHRDETLCSSGPNVFRGL